MACDRNGCENVMCNICIDGRYYVCHYCAQEFKALQGNEPKMKSQIGQDFVQFMTSPKPPFDGENKLCTVDEFFGKY